MSPYENLPQRSFWKTGVNLQHPLLIEDLYRKKFAITPSMRIATAGSCFAQHIARHLSQRGYNVLDKEPPPPGLDAATANRFGYRLYSARYGNIYLARQLKQLIQEALGKFTPQDAVWEKDGRFFDALRPSVEPNGLSSPDEVMLHRKSHLRHVRALLKQIDLLVFTFGLTEGWTHIESGTVYPTAPGTIAGRFDASKHALKVFRYDEILNDFLAVRTIIKRFNPEARFLLTVSPVPLTATAQPDHVLVATTHAKSTLRAVAGQLSGDLDDVDYFPSYEFIASPFSRGFFYEANLREVSSAGVEAVMRIFLAEHGGAEVARPGVDGRPVQAKRRASSDADSPANVCEELLLDAFARP